MWLILDFFSYVDQFDVFLSILFICEWKAPLPGSCKLSMYVWMDFCEFRNNANIEQYTGPRVC